MSHFPRLLGKLPERFRRKYEALTDTKVEVLRVHAVSPVSFAVGGALKYPHGYKRVGHMTTEEFKKMNSVTINGVEYVRADLTVKPLDIGEKRIIAAEGGWVFVGDCTDEADGTVTIRNAKNIRRWGTTAGLGQLSKGPTKDTVLDDYGTVRTRPLITIAVVSGW